MLQIKEFNATVNKLIEADIGNQSPYASSSQYRIIYRRNLRQYLETSEKLIKMIRIIASKEWYKTVSDRADGRSTHSFAFDPRFANIDKVYRELKNEDFSVKIDPAYSFSWKKSSQLYEVWSFMTVCRILAREYWFESNALIRLSGDRNLFPVLDSGKQVEFLGEDTRLLLSYDRRLPKTPERCSLQSDPFYYDCSDGDNIHNRPDIRIDIFDISTNVYVGSIIIECKYRKIRNFYRNGTYNSKEQLDSYYQDAQTNLYFNNLSVKHDIRPVKKVIAVTPDDTEVPRSRKSGHSVVRTFRPGSEHSIELLSKEIVEIIQSQMSILRGNP